MPNRSVVCVCFVVYQQRAIPRGKPTEPPKEDVIPTHIVQYQDDNWK